MISESLRSVFNCSSYYKWLSLYHHPGHPYCSGCICSHLADFLLAFLHMVTEERKIPHSWR